MSSVDERSSKALAARLEALKAENAELLSELENAYAQLTAVIAVSQDETRVAYSELQEKVIILEKKLFELELLSQIGEGIADEVDAVALRSLIVEKICLLTPVDLVVLHLVDMPDSFTVRERDLVFDRKIDNSDSSPVVQLLDVFAGEKQMPVIVSDFNQAGAWSSLRLRPDARSGVALPLWDRSFLGLLILNSRLASNFRADQEPSLRSFAAQASAALGNALRLQRLENALSTAIGMGRIDLESLEEWSKSESAVTPGARRAVRQWILRLVAKGPGSE